MDFLSLIDMDQSLSWRADSRLWNSKFYYSFTGEDVSTCSATSVSNPYSHTCFVSSICRLPILRVHFSQVFIPWRNSP